MEKPGLYDSPRDLQPLPPDPLQSGSGQRQCGRLLAGNSHQCTTISNTRAAVQQLSTKAPEQVDVAPQPQQARLVGFLEAETPSETILRASGTDKDPEELIPCN